MLIEAGGARLLTDPVLRGRVAHLTRRADPVDASALTPIDAVLLSHAHRDHLDLPTLKAIGRELVVVAPRGSSRLLRAADTVHEVDPGDQVEVAGVQVRATPAEHDVRRAWREQGSVGYVVHDRVYFAGDTAAFGGMAQLAGIDLALIPVWGWGTSLGAGHMDPTQAAEAAALIRPRTAVPIHWGTYFPAHAGRQGHRLLRDPPHDFARRVAEASPDIRVVVPAIGGRLAL